MNLVRLERGSDNIPREIASVVSQKFTFCVSVTERSFMQRNIAFQVNSIETSLADKALFHRLGIRHCNSHHLSFHLLLVVQVYVEKVSVLIILRHRLLLLIPLWVIWRKPMLIAGNDAPLCALYVLLLP